MQLTLYVSDEDTETHVMQAVPMLSHKVTLKSCPSIWEFLASLDHPHFKSGLFVCAGVKDLELQVLRRYRDLIGALEFVLLLHRSFQGHSRAGFDINARVVLSPEHSARHLGEILNRMIARSKGNEAIVKIDPLSGGQNGVAL